MRYLIKAIYSSAHMIRKRKRDTTVAESSGDEDDTPALDLEHTEPAGNFEIKAIQLTAGSYMHGIFKLHAWFAYYKLFSVYDRHEPLPDQVQESEQAGAAVEETKALKQISFPEMDSDALPSAFCIKVLSTIGKWQMKMHDLSKSLDPANPSMTAFPDGMS